MTPKQKEDIEFIGFVLFMAALTVAGVFVAIKIIKL